MNDKIKELAAQARKALAVDAMNGGEFNMQSYEEKFAELIVQECISVMKSTVDESIDFERKLDETSSWIESDIKRHFGVE